MDAECTGAVSAELNICVLSPERKVFSKVGQVNLPQSVDAQADRIPVNEQRIPQI